MKFTQIYLALKQNLEACPECFHQGQILFLRWAENSAHSPKKRID